MKEECTSLKTKKEQADASSIKALQKEIAGLKQKLDAANTAAEAAASTEAAQKADTQSVAAKLKRRIIYLEQNQTQLLRVPTLISLAKGPQKKSMMQSIIANKEMLSATATSKRDEEDPGHVRLWPWPSALFFFSRVLFCG